MYTYIYIYTLHTIIWLNGWLTGRYLPGYIHSLSLWTRHHSGGPHCRAMSWSSTNLTDMTIEVWKLCIHTWLVVGPPLWKIWTSIGMMTATQYFWENKIDVPNHQPDTSWTTAFWPLVYGKYSNYFDDRDHEDNQLMDLWSPASMGILDGINGGTRYKKKRPSFGAASPEP